MTAHPNTVVANFPQDEGFSGVRHEIEQTAEALRAAHPAEERFSVADEYALSRAASGRVLRILDAHGVLEAGRLAKDMAESAEEDPLTDLSSLAAKYESDYRFKGSAEAGHMAVLAEVVSGTAQATVAAVLDRGATSSAMERARMEVIRYDDLKGSEVGDTLHVLLDEAEAVPLSGDSSGQLAA